jgi:hypothetical protein
MQLRYTSRRYQPFYDIIDIDPIDKARAMARGSAFRTKSWPGPTGDGFDFAVVTNRNRSPRWRMCN